VEVEEMSLDSGKVRLIPFFFILGRYLTPPCPPDVGGVWL